MIARALVLLWLIVAAAVASACSTNVSSGRDALLQVKGGEFHSGDFPTSSPSGPAVSAVDIGRTKLPAGMLDEPVKGALSPGATAVAIALAGDHGYWIMTAGPPDVQEQGYPSFMAALSIAARAAPGDAALLVRAVDENGRFGDEYRVPVTIMTAPLPDGKLVVSLAWDMESDLDLHVVDPAGSEVFNRSINSWKPPPPGEPVDPSAWKTGGILDFDSNASCTIDGRRQENVVWKDAAPSGHFVVRVDTFSMCGEVSTRWSVDVRLDDAIVAHAQGATFGESTRFAHDRGAGVLAVEFDVP